MIGSFGELIFEITEDKVITLNNELSRTYKGKIAEHNPIYGPGKLRFQGRELVEITLSITLNSILTPNLRNEVKKINKMFENGEYNMLVLEGQVFGDFPFLITEYSEKNTYYNTQRKDFDVINLTLNLKEYIEDVKVYRKSIEKKSNRKTTVESKNNVLKNQKRVKKQINRYKKKKRRGKLK